MKTRMYVRCIEKPCQEMFTTTDVTVGKIYPVKRVGEYDYLIVDDKLNFRLYHQSLFAICEKPTELVKIKLPIERWDAEEWLQKHKDIWNHPIISDRTNKNGFEVADLMAEFTMHVVGNINNK
jgi:hypothetical protein